MVKLMGLTQGAGHLAGKTAEEIITYVARVSNPANQENFNTAPKLIAYLIKNKHWSPFEHAYMTLEIVTSRAIAAQILRHRSFTFQEFSQRYAQANDVISYPARRQDFKDRQNSIDDLPTDVNDWFRDAQREVADFAMKKYEEALKKEIAKEQARFLLPLSTKTTIYMTGSVRSWIHYLDLRSGNGTQKEHQLIAIQAMDIFCEHFPETGKALGWVVN